MQSRMSTSIRPVRTVVVSVMAAITLVSATGCVHVAPYERGALAHPMMTGEDISSGMEGHVRAVSEGGSGGLTGGGGGCGCN
jgi:hypothetical protein